MQQKPYLSEGSFIRGHKYIYEIQSVLGQGSFGITYLATTKIRAEGALGGFETEIKVAVKEFFMREFCSRHADGTVSEMSEGSLVNGYARKFRKEAENLSRLSHPGIVKVLEVFEANNTSYYSMEYIDGGSLDSYVRRCDGLPEEKAVKYIRQIADALDYMHSNHMLHLDLKPLNVMRSSDGNRLTLIDFGLSKQYEANGSPESSTSIGLGTPGYAPIEQSSSDLDRDFAPTLDIYALGATFYKLLSGQTPPLASTVLDEGLSMDGLRQKGISETSIAVIEKAMEPRKSRRVKNVAEFVSILSVPVVETPHSDIPTEATVVLSSEKQPSNLSSAAPASLDSSKKKLSFWLLGFLLAIAVAVFAVWLLSPSETPVPVEEHSEDASVSEEAPVQSTVQTQPDNPAVVELKSISLSRTSLTLEEGSTATLSVKFTPDNASERTVTWKTTDASVAKVSSSGKVSAVQPGSTTIIAISGTKEARCKVNVESKAVQPVHSTETVEEQVERIEIGNDVVIAEEIDEETPFMVVEKMPEFPGGTTALMAYLSENIKYPAVCRENNIQGRVLIQFIVNKDGSIVEPEVVKSVNPYLDNEALRVISAMPRWTPGEQRGKAVRVKYTVPLNFKLK